MICALSCHAVKALHGKKNSVKIHGTQLTQLAAAVVAATAHAAI
jgi:hypothetical protein